MTSSFQKVNDESVVTPPKESSFSTPSQSTQIVSTRNVDGHSVVLSRYGDQRWFIVGQPTNRVPSEQFVDFDSLSPAWRDTMKAILYRYLHRGREGRARPSARSATKLFGDARVFLRYLDRLGIDRLASVTQLVCSNYVDACKNQTSRDRAGQINRRIKSSTLFHRFNLVEALYELSQYTDDAIPSHPWPGTTAAHLAGQTGRGSGKRGGMTPLIPDETFVALFGRAWSLVSAADSLLVLRDKLLAIRSEPNCLTRLSLLGTAERRILRSHGWRGTRCFGKALLELRIACYIVIASVSGCRSHELSFLQVGAYFKSEDYDELTGEMTEYWWMRSMSTKTGEGRTTWMIPEAAVTALKVMERWAKPYQEKIDAELAQRRAVSPLDPEIAEACRHRNALFLCATPLKGNQVRTMSGQMLNLGLKTFARNCDLSWPIASHQFRRKFANYAARSQFGDLRYLRQHFKHWSMDMTLSYALNGSQELELYAEIQYELDGIKKEVVDTWLQPDTPLAGGYGRNILAWRGNNPVTLFKDHRQMVQALADSTSIRSNGHAWCTADDNLCVGNDLERTRCANCSNAVIGPQHTQLFRGFYDHLMEVKKCDDIGEGGMNVVRRDMERCRAVLEALTKSDVV